MPDIRTLFPLKRLACGALVLALTAAAGVSHGRDRDERDCKRDQDCARQAFVKGEIRPLSAVLAAVREKVPGDIIEIELEREDGIWIYEVKVLPRDGRRKKLEIDARTLDILKID